MKSITLYTTIFLGYINIERITSQCTPICTTVVGAYSADAPGALSSVSCSSGHTMTSCGYYGHWYNAGSYIDADVCYAKFPSNPTSGSVGTARFVRAQARCCDFSSCPFNTICQENDGIASTSSSNALCIDPNQSLFGCSHVSTQNAIASDLPSTNSCRALAKSSNTDLVVSKANCCSTDNENYEFECIREYGLQSDGFDGAQSTVYCPRQIDFNDEPWLLVGCGVASSNFDAIYTDSGDKCTAINSAVGSGVTPIAICCRILKMPTPQPSPQPTPQPSEAPTMDGCDFSLEEYLEQCYCDSLTPQPTPRPTFGPLTKATKKDAYPDDGLSVFGRRRMMDMDDNELINKMNSMENMLQNMQIMIGVSFCISILFFISISYMICWYNKSGSIGYKRFYGLFGHSDIENES